jgi:ECF sigma factor
VTDLLARWSGGDAAARDALVPLVYGELRSIARKCLAGQRSHTLQPTALVHEAYLRMVNRKSLPMQDRTHFFAVAAQMMRQKRPPLAARMTFPRRLIRSDCTRTKRRVRQRQQLVRAW